MKRLLLPIVLLPATLVWPAAASAAVISTSLGGYGEESVTFEVGKGPSSVIVVRSLADGRLELSDRSAPIALVSPGSPVGCHLRGRHTAVCRRPARYALANVTVRGGAHNDVIDARRLLAYSVSLEGGAGNDTLLAPRRQVVSWSTASLVGGPGRNVIVGGPSSTVSYFGASGPVRVDLASGVGLARRERDHIVDVASVEGSLRSYNFLTGSRSGGAIMGGEAGNRIVTLSAKTSVSFQGTLDGGVVPATSTVICHAPSTVNVEGVQVREILTGDCRARYLRLHLPMRSLSSAPISIEPPAAELRPIWTMVLTIGSHVVGQAQAPAGARSAPCRLNALGLRMLKHSGRVRVLVSEYYSWPEYPNPPQLWIRFTAALTLAGTPSAR
jgi:hypothetical protein